MKKWLALFLLAAVAVSADTLSQADRDKAVAELEGSRKAFLDATKGLSAAQLNFKSAPERWSVAECAEHIALSEGFIFGLVSTRVVTAPATPEKREAVKGKDELILKMMLALLRPPRSRNRHTRRLSVGFVDLRPFTPPHGADSRSQGRPELPKELNSAQFRRSP